MEKKVLTTPIQPEDLADINVGISQPAVTWRIAASSRRGGSFPSM